MSELKITLPLTRAMIVFGMVLITGAFFAYTYQNRGIYPYREYAFLLGIIGVAALLAGMAALKSIESMP